MLGWLGRKNEDARVFMCIKEIKMALSGSGQVGRAKILAMAHLLRLGIFEQAGLHGGIDRPLDYSRDELMALYSRLETIRNNSIAQATALRKNGERIGLPVPQFAIDHAKATTRGLEVWMSTLGAGIVPARLDDVRAIWAMFGECLNYVPEAISHLRAIEQQTSDATGSGELIRLSDAESIVIKQSRVLGASHPTPRLRRVRRS